MWIDRIASAAGLAALAVPAAADYARAPFQDRPLEVATLAFRVLEGEAVEVPAEDIPLAAAVASFLLISELGLAEAYEEAVGGGEDEDEEEIGEEGEEPDAYIVAYALLQAIRPWIAAVPQNPDLVELTARLDALLPTPERPAKLDSDPEAAEVVAQALVGQLESAANADLYLARDLQRAMDTVSAIAATGCASGQTDRTHTIRAAAVYFEDSLEAPLSVMAAEPAERIEDALDLLLGDEGDATRACVDLAAAFADAKRIMFP